MNIAVIPARKGSKRIPGKNLKEFNGQPIISWPIQTAINTDLFDKVIVSTDSSDIAEVAVKSGAEIPFMRSENLSGDDVPTVDVVADVIERLGDSYDDLEFVCCIYPTSIFVQEAELILGLEELSRGGWAYTFSATESQKAVLRGFVPNKQAGIKVLFPEYKNTKTQDLPVALCDAAQFYWGRPDAWCARRPIISEGSFPIVVSREMGIDIDTEKDWTLAEMLFKSMR